MNDTMLKLYVKMQSLMARDEGQDLVEYALVLSIIAIGSFTLLGSINTNIKAIFSNVVADLAA